MCGLGFAAGCGEREELSEGLPGEFTDRISERAAAVVGPNRLEGLPGEVYRSAADSPIRWQPWTAGTLKLAERAGKMVLAVIVKPQQPSFAASLAELEANGRIVDQINETYVPVLIDGDAVREMGVLAVDLCAEIGSGVRFPLVVWMTSDGNPVAWIPLPATPERESESVADMFMQSHFMVSMMWMEDEGYVKSNSRIDQANRRDRMLARRENRDISDQPAVDAVRALRQLTSLYDPLSRNFDEAGGLFPVGSLELLALGARMEDVPEGIRERSRAVLEYLLEDLIRSPMFDPLDGGVFSSRQRSSWALPGFDRDCDMQARVISSLMAAYGATGDERVLEVALGVLGFAEEKYETGEGLFCLGTGSGEKVRRWLWRMEDVESILSEDELDVWVRASGMERIGNLPSEVDPMRLFFRSNSIRTARTAEEISTDTGAAPDAVAELLSSARRKLLKVRSERLGTVTTLSEPNAGASFRMASAYAAIYRETGDESFREKAVAVLATARETFSNGPRLTLYPGNAEPSLIAARAFVYGLALQAALDVAAITLDEKWLLWADDLATTTAEVFSAEGYLRECPPDADLIGLPVTDTTMVYDDSTVGLISMAEARMEALGRPILGSFADLATGLPVSAITRPILHTDRIQAALVRSYGQRIVYGPEIGEEMKDGLSRIDPKVSTAVPSSVLPVVSGDQVVRIGPDGSRSPVMDAENIREVPLRGGRN